MNFNDDETAEGLAALIRVALRTDGGREAVREIVRDELSRLSGSAPADEELTVRDVARIKHVKPRTVYDWVARKRIRHKYTPGGQLRFLRKDVDKFQIGGV